MTFTARHRLGSAALVESALGRFVLDLVTYGIASGAALVVDYGLLLKLVAVGLPYLTASLMSFSAGSIVAYTLSVRFVFARRRATSREAEMIGFFAVGAAGLALTQLLLYLLVSRAGLPVGLAKIPTVGLVFLFNFLCRRSLVFAGAPISRETP